MGGGGAEETPTSSFAAGVNRSFLSDDLLTRAQITGNERSLSQSDNSRVSTATREAPGKTGADQAHVGCVHAIHPGFPL